MPRSDARPRPIFLGLENHCGGNVTVGSNPTPSALTSENGFDLGFRSLMAD